MGEYFGRRRFGSGRHGLPAVLQQWRRFQELGWVTSALAILGLSGLLAVASVWLWRSSAARSAPAEAAAPASAAMTVAFGVTSSPSAPQPSPEARDLAPPVRAAEAVDAQSTGTAASRPIVPFPAELRDSAVVGAAGAAPASATPDPRPASGTAAPKQPSRVTMASAEAALPAGSVFVSAPERISPASSAPGAAPTDAAPSKDGAVSIEEAQRLAARATNLLKAGDIAGARLLLARAASSGEARGAFLLAETYDPKVLARWNVRGIRADPEKAKALYRQAADAGLVEARGRVEALR